MRETKPAKTPEHLRMEAFYTERLTRQGYSVGWNFDKNGDYIASFARDAWAAWQEARKEIACKWCDGDGWLPGESPAKRCSHCNGQGTSDA